MLSLNRQEAYRRRYKQIRPDWRTGGELYESTIRRYIQPDVAYPAVEHRLLDLGCGAGGVIELLSTRVALPVGVDQDVSSLLRHRDEHIRLAVGRLERLPFGDESFHLVISSWVLEHIQAPASVFVEIARILKPGGHFVFLTPNARSMIALVNRSIPRAIQGRLTRWLYGREEQDAFPVVYRANSTQMLAALSQSAGLRQVRLETVGDPTYLAFNDLFFCMGVLLERLMPGNRRVHIVGDYVKPSEGCE